MNKEEKLKAIAGLVKEQVKILNKIRSIATKNPPKRWQYSIVRAVKVVALSLELKKIELQKRIIISQPTPKHINGGLVNKGTVEETGDEFIITKSGMKIKASKIKELEHKMKIREGFSETCFTENEFIETIRGYHNK